MPLTPDLREFCQRCKKLTPSRTVEHPSGIEYLCVTCGAQVDFLHNEESEVPFSAGQAAFTDDDLAVDEDYEDWGRE